jgi:hypothetical protein
VSQSKRLFKFSEQTPAKILSRRPAWAFSLKAWRRKFLLIGCAASSLKIDKGYQVAKRVRDLASLRAKTYVMIRLSAISIWSAAGTS